MTHRSSIVERRFPNLTRHNHHELEVSNTEYVCDVYGQQTYTSRYWYVNPGIAESFAYASGLANNFEIYKMISLEYFYKPFVADLVGASVLNSGWVALVFDPDPDNTIYTIGANLSSGLPNTPYINKQQLLEVSDCVSGKSSYPLALSVDCKKHCMNERYVRQGGNSINSDLRMSDMGLLILGVGGQQTSGQMVGEIYVRYKLKFMRSHVSYGIANTTRSCHYSLSGGTLSFGNAFGTTQTPQPGSNLLLTFFQNAGSSVCSFNLPELPQGTNFLVYYQVGGISSAWTFSALQYTHCAPLNILYSAYTSSSGLGPITSSTMTLTALATVQASTRSNIDVDCANFAFTGGTYISTPVAQADLFVVLLPSSMTS